MLILVSFCIWVLPRIIVYFMPFVIAGIIALIANPLVRFMERKVKIARRAGTAMVIVIVIALVVVALYFIIYNLIIQLIGFIQAAPETWESVNGAVRGMIVTFRRYLSRFPLPVREWSDTLLDNIYLNVSDWLRQATSLTVEAENERSGNVGYVIISIIMGILASYFFLADRDYLVGLINRHFPKRLLTRWDLVYSTIKNAVGGYFIAQLKIMAVIYIELFIGFLVLGVKYSFLIAFLIALLDFLPFFGTGAVMLPWAIVKVIQQDYRMALGLVIVWAIGQAIRQLIQPKLVGDSIGLEPIPTLFLLYLGFRLGGAFGLILAVPIGMVIINLYKAGVFSNFKYSVIMLARGIETMRKFTPEELKAEGIEDKAVQTGAEGSDNGK